MTLWEYLTIWLETYVRPQRAKKTVEAYQYALNHLSQETRNTPIDQLTPYQLQRECNALAMQYSRQAQLLYVALRAALTRAAKLRLIEHSPMELCEKPGHEKAEICYLTPAEASAYLSHADGDPRRHLLALMLCLGLRRNEARGLRPDDLGADGVLRIRHQRTKDGLTPLKSRASRRDIPVPEPLRAFFDGPKGEYLVDCSETALRRAHLAILAECGIDHRVTLHGLRHTCATLAMQNGGQLVSVQRLLGHAHFGLTADTYIHIDLCTLQQTTGRIFSLISPPIYGDGARLEIV